MDEQDGTAQTDTGVSKERPYRSHLRPACFECRKRKSRCKTTVGSASCILCQLRGTPCNFPKPGPRLMNNSESKTQLTNDQSGASVLSRSVKHDGVQLQSNFLQNREKPTSNVLPNTLQSTQDSLEDTMGFLNETQDDSPHVVGPALLIDDDELENYLFAGSERSRKLIRPATTNAMSQTRPVVFTTVHRRPVGTVANQTYASAKCEIIEKLIEPFSRTLVDLFFEKVNPCFPILNKTSFLKAYSNVKGQISPAVLSCLYANTLTYWDSCIQLTRPCPDKMFVWLQANEALNSESFLSPGLSTVLAMVLNIGGRPSTSVFGNGSLIGTAVARANALGLNRDPTAWNISEAERLFRIRIWWLLVLQDRWWSLAYGTPLQISRKQFDVPLPTIAPISRANENVTEAIFVSLTTLTVVLGEMLEHIYDLAGQNADSSDTFEHSLNCWEDAQSDEIRRIIFRGTNLSHLGAANLRMAYLSVKFLLKRLQIGIDMRNHHDWSSKGIVQAQRSAEDIVLFVQELGEEQARGFWFPMHAYSITSATAFLLRSALGPESKNQSIKRQIVIDMIKALRVLKLEYSWDLADHCLSMYDSVVEKLEVRTTSNVAVELDTLSELDSTGLEDMFTSIDDYMMNDFEELLCYYPVQPLDQT